LVAECAAAGGTNTNEETGDLIIENDKRGLAGRQLDCIDGFGGEFHAGRIVGMKQPEKK
jgi:hypothetical protein